MMGEGFERGSVLLGEYRVESVLGRGGMAVVLKVTHVQLEEELAVKVLLPERATNQDVAARFLREAQAVARLRGEHVARVSDVGVLPDGLPCMSWSTCAASICAARSLVEERCLPGRRSITCSRHARHWLKRTHGGSCTATSSRPICS